MSWVRFFCGFVFLLHMQVGAKPLSNRDVLVIYNSNDPESEQLAKFYDDARGIPGAQILGLKIPLKADLSRSEYEEFIAGPLRKQFDEMRWWKRGKDGSGLLVPTENRIRALVLMKGVPLRIAPLPVPPPAPAKPEDAPKPALSPAEILNARDEASVDSELAMIGIETLPTKGILKNSFFDSKQEIGNTNLPHLMLVTRIDAPSYSICKQMITDSIETEKHGLWGRTYVDIANKFPQGDEWLDALVKNSILMGCPTLVDRFNETLPKNYPMSDAAVYYGWYDENVSGPFLNPRFIFRRGAVAVHIHSFSADQLTDPHKNWCAPLLVRGAAATVGNVYEPYLHLTHHLQIMHNRLLQGWTFAEATWAALPATSWQAVAIGDPLYRPFMHINGTGQVRPEDRDFRLLRAARREWSEQDGLRIKKVAAAAEKLKSGDLAEALALDFMSASDFTNAENWLRKAREYYVPQSDRLRQDMQLIAIERMRNNKQIAINELRRAQSKYGPISASEALSAWLNILDPPPPPPPVVAPPKN